MDSAKQAVRWGIPGWLFFLFFFINHTFFLYLFNLIIKKSINFSFSTIITSYKIDFSSILVIVGILGIPIGYIIYQFYFIMSRSLPKDISELCNLKSINDDIDIKSKEISKEWVSEETKNNESLGKLKSEGVISFIFKNFSQWTYRRILNIIFWRRTKTVLERLQQIESLEIKWALVDVLTRKKILENKDLKNGYDEIIRRDNHLSDIIHSLGAVSYSTLFAYIFYFLNLTKNLYFNLYLYNNGKIIFIGTFLICYLFPLMLTIIFIFVAKYNARKSTVHKITFIREFIKSK